jgi:hypothetical protein
MFRSIKKFKKDGLKQRELMQARKLFVSNEKLNSKNIETLSITHEKTTDTTNNANKKSKVILLSTTIGSNEDEMLPPPPSTPTSNIAKQMLSNIQYSGYDIDSNLNYQSFKKKITISPSDQKNSPPIITNHQHHNNKK